MNRLFIRLALSVASLVWLLPAGAQETMNEYGLKTVSSVKAYEQLVQKDSMLKLVPLTEWVPGIVLDIRYAGSNNFMGQPMYSSPGAFLALPAARALRSVQKTLKKSGYGLKVFDGYRPYAVTVDFYRKVKDSVFVASPRTGSRHNRGCAVDLTLIDLKTGKELPMPTGFDDFTEKAHTNYSRLEADKIRNRELLKKVMVENGFRIMPDEWWHYDFAGWQSHPILDISFEELSVATTVASKD